MKEQNPLQKILESKLSSEFNPSFLKVINESHQHAVPPGSETHFRVELVSEQFNSLNRVARSRKVYSTLAQELSAGVHALSLKLFSPKEWDELAENAGVPSPACMGGSKGERN